MKTEKVESQKAKVENRSPAVGHFGFRLSTFDFAFTLLEVLVVVAIIALLMAILLPSLRQARDQSRRSACSANVHQIAFAYQDYLNANNGRFMQGMRTNLNYGGKQGLFPSYQVAKPLNKHIGMKPAITNDAKVFRCPSDAGSSNYKPTCYDYIGTSYMTNTIMTGEDQLIDWLPYDPCNQPFGSKKTLVMRINKRIQATDTDPNRNPNAPAPGTWGKGLKRDQVTTDPSRLLLLGDFGWNNTWNFQTAGVSTSEGLEDWLAAWHGRRCSYNIGFMDGHVEFLTLRKGVNVAPRYTVIPFKDLLPLASTPPCGQEVPEPWY